MIRRILEGEKLTLPEKGIEAQKIRSLWEAYSARYEFCRFFTSENSVIGALNESTVLYCNDNISSDELNEISAFLSFSGAREIFCSEEVGLSLSELLNCKVQLVNLMRFTGCSESTETEVNPPLAEVFEVIQSAFGLTEDLFEPWLLDMSHRIRHGVSEVRRLEKTVLVVQYASDNEVLLSQIATHPDYQRKGGAKRLISAVCADYPDSSIYVICEDCLVDFYKSIGFTNEKMKCNLVL
ncbi:MAG: GNAT family N-acetyltransferase [Oscillospiraceae bacterium]